MNHPKTVVALRRIANNNKLTEGQVETIVRSQFNCCMQLMEKGKSFRMPYVGVMHNVTNKDV